MIKLDEMQVTEIQFFDHTHEVQTGENESEWVTQYSANVVLDDSLIIQLAGSADESERPSIPTAVQQCWLEENAVLQDWGHGNLDLDDVERLLEKLGIENDFNFLSEY